MRPIGGGGSLDVGLSIPQAIGDIPQGAHISTSQPEAKAGTLPLRVLHEPGSRDSPANGGVSASSATSRDARSRPIRVALRACIRGIPRSGPVRFRAVVIQLDGAGGGALW